MIIPTMWATRLLPFDGYHSDCLQRHAKCFDDVFLMTCRVGVDFLRMISIMRLMRHPSERQKADIWSVFDNGSAQA